MPGQIARWRAFRSTSPQVRIGHDALIQIKRDFAPDRGLLFPFLAPSVAVARQLLYAALRDAPARYELQLPGGPIHDALLAAGAVPLEHLFELTGTIGRACALPLVRIVKVTDQKPSESDVGAPTCRNRSTAVRQDLRSTSG